MRMQQLILKKASGAPMALPDDGLEVEPSTHSLSLFMEKLAIDWMARLLDCPLDPKLSLSSLTKNCYLLCAA